MITSWKVETSSISTSILSESQGLGNIPPSDNLQNGRYSKRASVPYNTSIAAAQAKCVDPPNEKKQGPLFHLSTKLAPSTTYDFSPRMHQSVTAKKYQSIDRQTKLPQINFYIRYPRDWPIVPRVGDKVVSSMYFPLPVPMKKPPNSRS